MRSINRSIKRDRSEATGVAYTRRGRRETVGEAGGNEIYGFCK